MVVFVFRIIEKEDELVAGLEGLGEMVHKFVGVTSDAGEILRKESAINAEAHEI